MKLYLEEERKVVNDYLEEKERGPSSYQDEEMKDNNGEPRNSKKPASPMNKTKRLANPMLEQRIQIFLERNYFLNPVFAL
jgi:hypothetical protein